MTKAFPLHWPFGQPRTKARTDSAFKVKPSQAFDEMMAELARFGATNVVVSSNIPIRSDGTPYRDGLTDLIQDPGIAVYFVRNRVRQGVGVDTYRRPWENCRAIGLSIKCFRDAERHGAHQVVNQAFTGFLALPAPSAFEDGKKWFDVLGVSEFASTAKIIEAHRAIVRDQGGATAEINAAKIEGLAARGASTP